MSCCWNFLVMYIYICIYVCVCVCVCARVYRVGIEDPAILKSAQESSVGFEVFRVSRRLSTY